MPCRRNPSKARRCRPRWRTAVSIRIRNRRESGRRSPFRLRSKRGRSNPPRCRGTPKSAITNARPTIGGPIRGPTIAFRCLPFTTERDCRLKTEDAAVLLEGGPIKIVDDSKNVIRRQVCDGQPRPRESLGRQGRPVAPRKRHEARHYVTTSGPRRYCARHQSADSERARTL